MAKLTAFGIPITRSQLRVLTAYTNSWITTPGISFELSAETLPKSGPCLAVRVHDSRLDHSRGPGSVLRITRRGRRVFGGEGVAGRVAGEEVTR